MFSEKQSTVIDINTYINNHLNTFFDLKKSLSKEDLHEATQYLTIPDIQHGCILLPFVFEYIERTQMFKGPYLVVPIICRSLSYGDESSIWNKAINLLPIADEIKEAIPVYDNELIMKKIKEQRELSRVKTRSRTKSKTKSKSKTIKRNSI
jgi:hypothetical protein